VFVAFGHYQPRLINASMAGAYPSEATQMRETEVIDSDKHSSLLEYEFNYGRKMFNGTCDAH
jgi:hypothetical protein